MQGFWGFGFMELGNYLRPALYSIVMSAETFRIIAHNSDKKKIFVVDLCSRMDSQSFGISSELEIRTKDHCQLDTALRTFCLTVLPIHLHLQAPDVMRAPAAACITTLTSVGKMLYG